MLNLIMPDKGDEIVALGGYQEKTAGSIVRMMVRIKNALPPQQ